MAEALVKIPQLNWKKFDEELFLNPRLPAEDEQNLRTLYTRRPFQDDHLWLSSSGTGSQIKLIALSREALLASAEAVNRQIESTGQDRWLLTLPTFHVGGLGILARAHLSGAGLSVLERWSASLFLKQSRDEKITLTSLVPAQLRELVETSVPCPPTMRFIFIGGGALSPELKARALQLNYPVYETYGMTECGSQVASEDLSRQGMISLPIWKLSLGENSCLKISGPALASVILDSNQCLFPQRDGFFQTQDRVRLEHLKNQRCRVIPEGRSIEFQKIRGENVNLARLQSILEKILSETKEIRDAAVYFDLKDSEVSVILKFCAPEIKDGQRLLSHFNERVLPFERATQLERVEKIERTALGKIIYRR